VQYVGELLMDLGLDLTVTRRGLLNATLSGRRSPAGPGRGRARRHDRLHGHPAQGLGRLEVTPLGTHSARFAEGAHVTIFTDSGRFLTGTVLPLKSSGHQYGDEVDTQGVGWPLVEVRVDEPVVDASSLPPRHPGRRLRGAGRQPVVTPPATSRAGTWTTRPASRPRSAPSSRWSTRRSRRGSAPTCSSPSRRRSATARRTAWTPTWPR
jgi:hypothetical protein